MHECSEGRKQVSVVVKEPKRFRVLVSAKPLDNQHFQGEGNSPSGFLSLLYYCQ